MVKITRKPPPNAKADGKPKADSTISWYNTQSLPTNLPKGSIICVIDGQEAMKSQNLSASGKSRTLATTHGMQSLVMADGTDSGCNVNLTVSQSLTADQKSAIKRIQAKALADHKGDIFGG